MLIISTDRANLQNPSRFPKSHSSEMLEEQSTNSACLPQVNEGVYLSENKQEPLQRV
ncbi:rCG44752 [Rattus norvegicus]|uniref:RCG44752 n=1 Tax=Rattus norvegicus TaxID=10116 RepID=A6I554_RAT|nr:rCG44752 [Rattus norvegicus]